jgi:hypothetical protein
VNYPGDKYTFVFPLQNPDGSAPQVTSAPTINILNLATMTAVLAAPGQMTAMPGTQYVYTYTWNTALVSTGQYVALISYVANGAAMNNRFLEKLQLGDTYLTGPVALDATVAKDATVARDATVLHRADYTSPDNSGAVNAIVSAIGSLPQILSTQDQHSALAQLTQDIYDATLGSWVINKNTNTMSLFRRSGGALLAQFSLANSNANSSRTPS